MLYRNILLHSWIPEYIFNLEGDLVDWTTDNYDDGRYQVVWDYSKEIKEIKVSEASELIIKK